MTGLLFAVAILGASCSSSPELTADEIIGKSREHFESAATFETRQTQNIMLTEGSVLYTSVMRIAPPGAFTQLDEDGSVEIIAVDRSLYRRSESSPGMWTRTVGSSSVDNTNNEKLLVAFFPPKMFDAELIETTDETYVIEGFGTIFSNQGIILDKARLYELTVRKSDFALIKSVRFDSSTVSLGENGEITRLRPKDPAEDDTFPDRRDRFVIEISRYNEDLGIEAPPESDIVVDVLRIWPTDESTIVEPQEEVGFYLSEATAIMELSIEPSIELIDAKIDHSSLNEYPGVVAFKPVDNWDSKTEYTATMSWGDSGDALQSQSWTFTTR